MKSNVYALLEGPIYFLQGYKGIIVMDPLIISIKDKLTDGSKQFQDASMQNSYTLGAQYYS